MQEKQNLLEQFENLSPPATNAEWNAGVFQKLKVARDQKSILKSTNSGVALGICLLVVNVITVSNYFLQTKNEAPKNELKELASDILVQTNSSKY